MKRVISLSVLSLAFAAPAFADEASEKAAAKLLEDRMKTQDPEKLAILKAVQGKDVVVVQGSMDHIEQILAAANIRHTVITPEQVSSFDLRGDQTLMVNCPGNIPEAGVRKIEKFVRAGGLLYTTDWSLLNLVQKAFPGTIAHNGASTGNEVTQVHVHSKHDDLMSNMLLRKDRDPQWWLEGGSYPIKIIDKKKVEVLASSKEMEVKYGAAPVVVRFRWDDGEVIHVVSHFYRQMDAQGPAVAAKSAIDDVDGLTEAQKKEFKSSAGAEASISNVESSYAFQRMTSNLITSKAQKNEGWRKDYGWTPKQEVVIEGRKVKKGDRVKVLSRNGARVRVRDDQGNEAEVDSAALMAQ
jgi:hypothetical protein